MMHILVTDNGPHPAEKWAHVSVLDIMQVIQIGPSASRSVFKAYRDVERKIFDVLIKFHGALQETEREFLQKDHARLHTDLADLAKSATDVAVQNITDTVKGSPFEEHFTDNKEVQAHVHRVLTQHFIDSLHIERCWHADRNPENEHVKAFNNKRLGL